MVYMAPQTPITSTTIIPCADVNIETQSGGPKFSEELEDKWGTLKVSKRKVQCLIKEE